MVRFHRTYTKVIFFRLSILFKIDRLGFRKLQLCRPQHSSTGFQVYANGAPRKLRFGCARMQRNSDDFHGAWDVLRIILCTIIHK